MADIARKLTAGERRYLTEVFGADLDYDKVEVHNTKAYFFQPRDTAITPNGEVYFPPESYMADFAGSIGHMAWLVHEVTHCWQHQKGMWVRTRAVLNRTYKYGDLSKSQQNFLSYSLEQQASIVADYFRIVHGQRTVEGQGAIADYRRVIPFLPAVK